MTNQNTADNPLLTMLGGTQLPPFPDIKPEHAEPALDTVLARARETVSALEALESPTWDTLVAPLEAASNAIHRVFSPVGNMMGVQSTADWRAAYSACIPKLSAFSSELGQNRRLFQQFEALQQSPEFQELDRARRTVIENQLRDFRLAGVDLNAQQRARVAEIEQALAQCSTKFEEQTLDATQAWSYQLDTPEQLAGLPQRAIDQAKAHAEAKDLSGYLITLDMPSYLAAMTYADDRELRAAVYEAYSTRASDQGPNAIAGEADGEAGHDGDNGPLIDQILQLRAELAALTGFEHYAARSLATKMASSAEEVEQFLLDLAQRAKPAAQQELGRLEAFAKRRDNIDTLQAWDIAYYSEKLQQEELALSDEDLRPYFPLEAVLEGMMQTATRLYGVRFASNESAPVWNEDVRAFTVLDQQGAAIGQFLVDPFARENKRSGAWMDDCQGRFRGESGMQLPVAFLVCNFSPPGARQPSLLSHNEVLTMFHEFGHGLHHLLTEIDALSVSGISGVAWDAVELPSQFMENWAWEREALDQFAKHWETGETIPDALYAKLVKTRQFLTGLRILRQVEFALFDLRVHTKRDPDVLAELAAVRQEVAVVHPPEWNRFPNAFSHVFGGGYAAGYYSYHWAEVLAADAFAAFKESGIFDPVTGERFLTQVLSQGGSAPAADLFNAFRGRPATPDALLAQYGLATNDDSVSRGRTAGSAA